MTRVVLLLVRNRIYVAGYFGFMARLVALSQS